MVIKFHLDSLKEEEETPEKKIYFVSPFVGSIHGNTIPTHLLKAYTYPYFPVSDSGENLNSTSKLCLSFLC